MNDESSTPGTGATGGAGSDDNEHVGWRCVKTRPKSEHLAALQLRQVPDVDVFCPRIRFQRATRRGKVWFAEALFPGYVFCRFDLFESLRHIQATGSVTGLVRFGDYCPVLPDAMIESLRADFVEAEPVTVIQTVSVGDEVEVTEGPFQGTVAYVTRLLGAAERVRILVEFLGQDREVEVSLTSLLGFGDARWKSTPLTR
ncbi:transcription/translation regulatory transformer protein RfaH [soil metagenome]